MVKKTSTLYARMARFSGFKTFLSAPQTGVWWWTRLKQRPKPQTTYEKI